MQQSGTAESFQRQIQSPAVGSADSLSPWAVNTKQEEKSHGSGFRDVIFSQVIKNLSSKPWGWNQSWWGNPGLCRSPLMPSNAVDQPPRFHSQRFFIRFDRSFCFDVGSNLPYNRNNYPMGDRCGLIQPPLHLRKASPFCPWTIMCLLLSCQHGIEGRAAHLQVGQWEQKRSPGEMPLWNEIVAKKQSMTCFTWNLRQRHRV